MWQFTVNTRPLARLERCRTEMYEPTNPLIVQSDRSILLEVHAERYEQARDAVARFAELEKSPEHVHSYRITPLSLWNAAAAGLPAEQVVADLQRFAKYGVPDTVARDVTELMGRFGKLRLLPGEPKLRLEVDDAAMAAELGRHASLEGLIERQGDAFLVPPLLRGTLKQKLARLGFPVDDRVGFVDGEALEVAIASQTTAGQPFALRRYQRDAVSAFCRAGLGHGVVVLPCGAGKTVVGLATMAELGCATLILCTGVTAARQWIREILDKTTLAEEMVGEYSGHKKQVRPITVTTYQIVSRRKGDSFPHLELFLARPWGLIIYDEVHLLPAPVFRVTAELQARRRLGLTATLVREDGLQTDVFSLIGPKRFDVPWREMEQTGFIAEALCHEVRVPMSAELATRVAVEEDPHRQYRLAAENPAKDDTALGLIRKHDGEGILVIGQYIRQLERLAAKLEAPLITGKVGEAQREKLYGAFRNGEIKVLVVSKVANFAIDLPEASVCIQISGTFGSRQEEAQRLGRILRPKKRQAFFYSLVSRDSPEMRFAMNRQLFLTEQGYRYYIEDKREDKRLEAGPRTQPESEESSAATRTSEPGLAKVIPFPKVVRS